MRPCCCSGDFLFVCAAIQIHGSGWIWFHHRSTWWASYIRGVSTLFRNELYSLFFSEHKKNPVTFDQCNQFWKRNIIIRCRQMNRDVISNVSYDWYPVELFRSKERWRQSQHVGERWQQQIIFRTVERLFANGFVHWLGSRVVDGQLALGRRAAFSRRIWIFSAFAHVLIKRDVCVSHVSHFRFGLRRIKQPIAEKRQRQWKSQQQISNQFQFLQQVKKNPFSFFLLLKL